MPAIAIAFLAVALSARANPPATPSITGMYSNLEIVDGDDLLGMEVYLVPGHKGYVAVVQCAEGGIPDPVVVPVSREGAQISFELAKGGCGTRFTGTISQQGLRGRFTGQSESWLPRKNGFWQ